MQGERNPFDRDPQSVPLMRFMLHTNSLSGELLLKDSPAYRLVKLNCFKEIRIIPLPTDNNDIRRVLNTNGLVCTEYYSYESGVALKTSDGSIHAVADKPHYNLSNIWEPIISNSKVTHADFYASSICDYLVVGASEPSLMCKVAGDNIITAELALELVRILLTAHGRFYVGAGIPVSEWSYYEYRFRKLFKGFQYASMVAAYAHEKGLSQKIHNYFGSLGTRLEFICRAYDKVAFFSLKTANYDHNTQLYHLAYFVMLITGVFDDLARIIGEFYHMNMKRERINLRVPEVPESNKSRTFYQLLQSRNASLYEFLTAADTQRDIKTFYPLRDSLQHREFFWGVHYREGSEPDKNVFELSSETADELKKKSDSLIFIIRGNPCFLDPLLFIKWSQEVTIRLVNRVLSHIDWDSFCANLPKDIQDKIHASNESYEKGFGYLLGWPEEPLYF